jgi:hypothetical protein
MEPSPGTRSQPPEAEPAEAQTEPASRWHLLDDA